MKISKADTKPRKKKYSITYDVILIKNRIVVTIVIGVCSEHENEI